MYGVTVLTKCVFDVSENDKYEEPRVRNAKLLSLRHFLELLNVFFIVQFLSIKPLLILL